MATNPLECDCPRELLFIRTYVVDWITSLLRPSMAYSLEDVTVQGDKQWKILQMLWQVQRDAGKMQTEQVKEESPELGTGVE